MDGVRRLVAHPVSIRSAQIVIGALFGIAAIAKLADLPAFAQQVHNFRILPVAVENLAAMILPWIELTASLSLVLGIRPRSGGVVAAVLMGLFTVAVASAMARGLDFECGCFGTSDATRVGWEKLLVNLGETALAVIASLRPQSGGPIRAGARMPASSSSG